MNILTDAQIVDLLADYEVSRPADEVIAMIQRYLGVFATWSRRMNLSTVTDPVQVVQRHFGESLVLAGSLPPCTTLLDLGSGAGFPGLPIAMSRQAVRVTLAESQKKKAAFLREAASQMGLSVEIWADRAENLGPARKFDVVTLRAVDGMTSALEAGRDLLGPGGTLAYFAGMREQIGLPAAQWEKVQMVSVPNSSGQLIFATLAL